jgi:3-oxoadipate enol-lactonase
MKDEFIRANGTTLRIRVEGPLNAPVLLFSNSLATDLSMWDDQVAEFAKFYRVVRYDTRGHGKSEAAQPPYSLSTLVEDVRSLLDALGIDAVHYCGLSLGGMIGQLFAARYPQRLLSLALCDSAAKLRREVWEERIATAHKEGIRQMIHRTSVNGYIGSATAIMEMDNFPQLPRIATPTLIVVGGKDPATPPSDSELMHEKIAGSKMVVIEDAAHLPNIEQIDEFNNILGTFLKAQNEQAQETSLASQTA